MAVSEAQKKATAKYEKENYDKVLTRFPKGTKEKILQTGAKSVNSFIISAVDEKLDRIKNGEPETAPVTKKLDKYAGYSEHDRELLELQDLLDRKRAKDMK